MPVTDRDDTYARIGDHIVRTASAYMPSPVLIEIIDGSMQLEAGWVEGRHGDKTVRVLATGPYDFRTATPANPDVVWVMPPNPSDPGGFYWIISKQWDVTASSRAPSLLVSSISTPAGSGGVDAYVSKSLFDAQTILAATSDNTPAALSLTEQTVLGRATGGNIAALAIDSDLSSVSASDDTVPSAKATKAALDGKAAASHSHAAADITSGTLAHERGGIEADISAVVKGDLIVGTGAGAMGLKIVGADGTYLKANSAVAGGVEWAAGSGGGGIATVKENGVNVVTSADTLDVKDLNVEDLSGGDAALYLDLPSICQGRLTLTTGVPVTTSDVTAATTLYFTPFRGSQVSLFDGTRWKKYAFTERSIAVPATTNTPYDVYLYDNAGTLTLELTAWTNDTTRATALTTQDGIYVKTGALTRRYLGSFRTTGVSGQTEVSTSRSFVYNYYHRIPHVLIAQDTTDSWSYSTAAFRAANNSTTVGVARVECFIGVAESLIQAHYRIPMSSTSAINASAGIGIDSTTVNSAQRHGDSSGTFALTYEAHYVGMPAAGYHYIQALEYGAGSATQTWYGDASLSFFKSGMEVLLER